MSKRILILWPVLLFLVVLTPVNSFASDLALVHAKVYVSPTNPPLEDATILIHDGRIAAVGSSASTKPPHFARAVTVIDCQGLVVTAGFWNSHVHILPPSLLQAQTRSAAALSSQLETMFTRWGFTTVFDIASVLDNTNNIRRRIASGEIRGPRILTVGEPFWGVGGTPIYVRGFLQENHIVIPDATSPEQAAERVRQEIHDGADGIKIFAGSIQEHSVLIMPVDLATAIVQEAHREGKPVFAHPSNRAGIEVCLKSGVDILAHTTPEDGPWPPELVQRIKAANMALIPTFTLFADISPDKNEEHMRPMFEQLKAYSDAGGQILFGTDVGYIDHFDTAEEFQLMAKAGLTYQQILASLTTNPTARFGYAAHSGRIAKGLDADLVVLRSDPAQDVTGFSKVAFTIRKGKIIYGKP
jgi:imidazolonepropionase-like amidohydrolase